MNVFIRCKNQHSQHKDNIGAEFRDYLNMIDNDGSKKFKYDIERHSFNLDTFNKLIDSGPDGSNDFAVTFVGDSTTGVECKIAATGADQSISFSVEVGYDSENTTVLTQP